MPGWHHDNAKWNPKKCAVCGAEFAPSSGAHKFCSGACRGKWKYITGATTTASQYEYISGNWGRYFSRLLARSFRRENLSRSLLLHLLEQQGGRCALSGVRLTCQLERGVRTWTNASIDRIDPTGGYTPDNVHLVCAAVNGFKHSMQAGEFVWWCRQVSEHNPDVPQAFHGYDGLAEEGSKENDHG